MPVTSLAELREALRTATPGETIDLAPGEYNGPILIDIPVRLRGQDRKTVLWRRGGPVIYIRAPGVTLERLLIERTVQAQGPLVVHSAGCAPTGKESMALDELISLGELVPGSTLILPLEVETRARAEISSAGLYGAQIAPALLETPGKHLVWLTLDGKTIMRGEVLLGELAVREGDKTRYLWLSGSVLDTAPVGGQFCLAIKKTRLYPSANGLMLEGQQLAALDSSNIPAGRYAFIQRDPSGALFLHLPGKPPLPVLVNGTALTPLTRVLLHEKDTLKIGNLTLSVHVADQPPFSVEPRTITFADFDEHFPEPLNLTLDNGKSAWKGHAVSVVPWLEVTPGGDFRVPPSRSHTWAVQLNGEALSLPNGLHEATSGVLVIGSNAVIGVDVRVNVRRPDVSLEVEPLDLGSVEWGWPAERTATLSIGNLGRGTWTGSVKSGVPWLEVVAPTLITCGPWSEVSAEVRFVPSWDVLTVGTRDIAGALVVSGPHGDIPVTARLEVLPARGHLTLLTEMVAFDEVERNAPLPDATFEVRNDGGGAWAGTVRAVNGWVRLKPDEIVIEPGATAEIDVGLLDVPADLALDTPILIDEIHLEDTDSTVAVGVQMTVVERPPYLVASPVSFPPFVKGDSPPEAELRVYNNGPARWRGQVVANKPWLTVADTWFGCEPGGSVEIFVNLNGKVSDAVPTGFSQWEDALSVTGGREPLAVSVQVDLRDTISELHLDTPILNFGQIDGASSGLPVQTVRLVNASPAPWTGKVQVCVPWLSLQSTARHFDLEVPGMTMIEFPVAVSEEARWLPPGPMASDHALSIVGHDQELSIRALLVVNEWAPVLSITPERLTLTGDTLQTLTTRNTGNRPWTLQAVAVPWLVVTPGEFTLEPGKEQSLEIRRAIGPFSGKLEDRRAIIIVGPGREVEIEVQVSETVSE